MKKYLYPLLLLFSSFLYSQVGIGTTIPNSSAQLDVTSTTKGLLPPRMTILQRNSIVAPPEGLQLWCTNCGINGEMQVFDGVNWVNLVGGTASSTVVNGSIANCDRQSKTQVVEIVSISGKIWMDRNLGASRAATSRTDYFAYGCLYQWGRSNDGHASVSWNSSTAGVPVNGTTTTLSSTDTPSNALYILNNNPSYNWRSSSNDNLWQELNEINNPCPTDFKVPSQAEFQDLIDSYSFVNVESSFNIGLSSQRLKFVLAGYRENFSSGAIIDTAVKGAYWTNSTATNISVALYFGVSDLLFSNTTRAFGMSVRCIKI